MAGLGVLAATLTGTSTASAATTGYDRCPDRDFCLFTGAYGSGTMYTYRSSTPDTGWAGKHAVSWANRTRSYSCIFEAAKYQGAPAPHNDGYWWTEPATAKNYAAGDAEVNTAQYKDYMRSVRLAPTAHECWDGLQYIYFYASEDGAAKTRPYGSMQGEGYPDLVTRSAEGRLWVVDDYSQHVVDLGNGVSRGEAWSKMTAFTRHGDFTGDGNEDLIARGPSGGLWLYPGNGKGGLNARHPLSGNWSSFTDITATGDLNGDGKDDLIARSPGGSLWLYLGNGKGGFSTHRRVGGGWNSMTAIAAVGDMTGDGRSDLVALDKKGQLWLYPGNGKGGIRTPHVVAKGVGKPWQLLSIGDINGDGHPDLYVVSDETFTLYLSNGKGGLTKAKSGQPSGSFYPANSHSELFF
ncbi:FG-GAP-like repeat-containing protein [Streptacidiphilus sp. PAMC 29251]